MREMDSAKIRALEYSESVSELSEAETSGGVGFIGLRQQHKAYSD